MFSIESHFNSPKAGVMRSGSSRSSRKSIGTFSSDDEHVNVNNRKFENEPWCCHACPNEHKLVIHTSLRTRFAAFCRPLVTVPWALLDFFSYIFWLNFAISWIPRFFLVDKTEAVSYSCCCEVKNPDFFDVAGKIWQS